MFCKKLLQSHWKEKLHLNKFMVIKNRKGRKNEVICSGRSNYSSGPPPADSSSIAAFLSLILLHRNTVAYFGTFPPLFNQVFACIWSCCKCRYMLIHIKERVAGVLIDLAAKTQEVANQLWCRVYINMFCTQIWCHVCRLQKGVFAKLWGAHPPQKGANLSCTLSPNINAE